VDEMSYKVDMCGASILDYVLEAARSLGDVATDDGGVSQQQHQQQPHQQQQRQRRTDDDDNSTNCDQNEPITRSSLDTVSLAVSDSQVV